jgi:hypothetical protein
MSVSELLRNTARRSKKCLPIIKPSRVILYNHLLRSSGHFYAEQVNLPVINAFFQVKTISTQFLIDLINNTLNLVLVQ